MRLLKILAKVLVFLAFVLGVSAALFVIIVSTSDLSQHKDALIQKIKEHSELEFSVSGPIKLKLWPSPHLLLHDVSVPFNSQSGERFELKAQLVEAQFAYLSLATRDPEIKKLKVKDLELRIFDSSNVVQTFAFQSLSGRFISTCCSVHLNSFVAENGKSTLKGDLEIITDEKVPVVKGRIQSDFIDLSEIVRTTKQPSSKSKGIIPDFKLPFKSLSTMDLDLDIKIKSFAQAPALKNIAFQVKSEGSKLRIHPFTVNLYDGALEGAIELMQTKGEFGLLKLSLFARDLLLEKTLNQDSGIKKGRYDFSFDGQGNGSTLKDSLAHWNGKAKWVLGQTHIPATFNSSLSDWAVDFMFFLNPFSKVNSSTELTCSAALFEIENGRMLALNRIAAETTSLDLLGSGSIHLQDESLDFEFNLRKKHGIDLKIGDFTRSIRLTGTLLEPKISLNPKGVLKDGASILGAVASGGLSLVAEKVFESFGNEVNLCEKISQESL